jgi:hypothetical protein
MTSTLTGATTQPPPNGPPSESPVGSRFVTRSGVIVALLLGLLISTFLLYTLWALWPASAPEGVDDRAAVPASVGVTYVGFHFKISSDALLFVMVAVAGALGGTIHTLRSLSWYVGNRNLKWSWMPRYALLPLVAGSLATVFYLVIRAGLFSPSTATQQVSPYGFAALAALVGLFSEQAVKKLQDVSSTLLAPAPKGKDHLEDGEVPSAHTGRAALLGSTSATLQGTVDPGGQETRWFFEYGPDISYGSRSRVEMATGEGAQQVSAVVEQLAPASTYHYRLIAENASGRGEGSDSAFTTPELT